MDFADLSVVERHAKPVLQFSGGKDSLACLWLLQPYWPKLTLAWVNTGDAFPETVALVNRAKALVGGGFLEVKTDQPAHIEQWGYPVDLLPVRSHAGLRNFLTGRERPVLQAFSACCFENIMRPMSEAMRELGATLVIRGMRSNEMHISPTRSGDMVDGIEYLFPLLNWSAQEVRAYLKDKTIGLPEYYDYMGTSLDCMHCTAYLSENVGKRVYMAFRHPEAYREVSRRIDVIGKAASEEIEHLTNARLAGSSVGVPTAKEARN